MFKSRLWAGRTRTWMRKYFVFLWVAKKRVVARPVWGCAPSCWYKTSVPALGDSRPRRLSKSHTSHSRVSHGMLTPRSSLYLASRWNHQSFRHIREVHHLSRWLSGDTQRHQHEHPAGSLFDQQQCLSSRCFSSLDALLWNSGSQLFCRIHALHGRGLTRTAKERDFGHAAFGVQFGWSKHLEFPILARKKRKTRLSRIMKSHFSPACTMLLKSVIFPFWRLICPSTNNMPASR